MAGRRTETSYYRELVFGKTTKPYLAVVAPETYEIRNQKSPWEFTKAKHSWTYPGKEGETRAWRSIPPEMRWSSTSMTS